MHQCYSENQKESDQSSNSQDSELCFEVVKKPRSPVLLGDWTNNKSTFRVTFCMPVVQAKAAH